MKNAFLTFFTVAAAAGLAAAQEAGFQVNTPNNPLECVPTLIQWSGGQSPYTLLIQEPDANGTPVQVYPGITQTSFSWPTNITAGTSIGVSVRDNTGATAQSAPVTIEAGSTTSCIGASSGSSVSVPPAGSSTSGASTGPSTPVSTVSTSGSSAVVSSGTGTTTVPHSTSSSPSGASTSSSGSPSPTGGSSNGAMGNAAAMGAVGFIGAVVAAVMA